VYTSNFQEDDFPKIKFRFVKADYKKGEGMRVQEKEVEAVMGSSALEEH
jgi:hypothetical protein